MALGTPVLGTVAYSAASGTTVAPSYPTGVVASDTLILFVGQKPSTANSGTVTTPTGWTLRDSLTAAGGYGTTLGADTGNTNLFVYTKDTVAGTESGTLTVTVGTNDVSWAAIIRVPTGNGIINLASSTAQQTTTPGASLALTLAANPGLTVFDYGIWAMVVPTSIGAGASFSAPTLSATGATFAAGVELTELSSGNGNNIGGYIAYARVTGGTATAAPTATVTTAGTLTDLRGPLVFLRVRERYTRSQAESGSATDSAQTLFSPQLVAGVVDADTLNFYPLNGNSQRNASQAESVTSADSSTKTLIRVGSLTETGSASDAVTGGLLSSGTAADTLTSSDSSTSTTARAGAVSESGAASDALTPIWSLAATAADTATSTDSSTNNLIRAGSLTETGSASDTETGGRLIPGAASDTLASSESSTYALSRAGSVSDSGTASDSSTTLATFVATRTETGSAADSSTGTRSINSTASDTVTSSDAVATLFSPRGANGLINTDPLNLYVLNGNAAVIQVSEVLSSADSSTNTAVRAGVAAESGALSDTSAGSRVLAASQQETGASSDSSTIVLAVGRTAADTLAASDSETNTAVRAGSDSETLAATDAATVSQVRAGSNADTLTVVDAVATLFSPRGANGLINTDVLNLFPLNGNSSIYGVIDSISATDSSVSAFGNASTGVDTLSATDSTASSLVRPVSVAETSSVADTVEDLFSPRPFQGLINSDVLNLLPLNGSGTGVFRYESLTASDSSTSLILNVASVADTLSATQTAIGVIPFVLTVTETVTADDDVQTLFSPPAGRGLINTDVLNLLPLNGAGSGDFVYETLATADSSTRTGVLTAALTETLAASDSSARSGTQIAAVTETASVTDAANASIPTPVASGLINSDVLNLLPLNGAGPLQFVQESLNATDSSTRTGVLTAAVAETLSAADAASYSGVQGVAATEAASAADSTTGILSSPLISGLINTDVLNLLPLNGGAQGEFVYESLSASDSSVRSGTQTVSVAETATASDLVGALIPAPLQHGLINTDVLNLLPLNGVGAQIYVDETLAAADTSASTGSFSLAVVEPPTSKRGLLATDTLNRLALNSFDDAYEQDGIRDTIAGGFVLVAATQETLTATDTLLVAPQAQHGLINTDPLNTYVLNGTGTQFYARETLTPADSSSAVGSFSLSVSEPPLSGFGLLNTDPLNRLRLNGNVSAFDVGLTDTVVGGFILAASAADTLSVTDTSTTPVRPDIGLINTDVLNLWPLNGAGTQFFVTDTLSVTDAVTSFGTQSVSVFEPPVLGFGLVGTAPLNVFALNDSYNTFSSFAATDLATVRVSFAVSVNEVIPFLTDNLYPDFVLAPQGLINTDVLNLLPLNGTGPVQFVQETLSASDSLVATVQAAARPNQSGLINTDVLNLLPLNGVGDLIFTAEGLSAQDSLTVISNYNVSLSDSLTLVDSFGTIVPLPGQVNLYNTDPLNVWPLNGSGPLEIGVGIFEAAGVTDLAGTGLAAVAARTEVAPAVDQLSLAFAVFVTDTITVAANEVTFVIYFSDREETLSPTDSALQDYFALNAQPLAAVKVAYLSGTPDPQYIYAIVTDTGTTGRQPVQVMEIYASSTVGAIYATGISSGIELLGPAPE